MTGKRFSLTNPKNAFQEMKCGIDDGGNTLTFNEVVDKLNDYEQTCSHYEKRIMELKDEISELKGETRVIVGELK